MKTITAMLLAAGLMMPAAGLAAAIPAADGAVKHAAKKAFLKKSAPTRAGEMDPGDLDPSNLPVITEAPDGERKTYTRSAYMFVANGFDFEVSEDSGMASEMVFCEDGSVYLYSPLASFRQKVYIKGYRDENKITFSFPQNLLFEHFVEGEEEWDEVMCVNRLMLDTSAGDVFYVLDEDNPNEITFTIAENGSISMDSEFETIESGELVTEVPKFIMGLTYGTGEWAGFGDGSSYLTPFDKKPLSMPAGLKTERWALRSSGSGHIVEAAIDGNDVYITGISQLCPEGTVKGVIDGNKVTFESGQLLGVEHEWFDYYVYLNGVVIENGESYQMPSLEMEYDAAKRLMKSTGGASINVSGGTDMGFLLENYFEPEIGMQPEDISYYPADPQVERMAEYDPALGYCGIVLRLPNLNKDGYVLDPYNLSYAVRFNNEDYIFSADVYDNLTENTFWLPYEFESYDVEKMEDVRILYIYEEDIENVQVLMKYTDGDKEYITKSPIYGKSAVEEIETADSAPVYYDLTGRRLTKTPEKGIYIRVQNNTAEKIAL